jgi:predicted esterase
MISTRSGTLNSYSRQGKGVIGQINIVTPDHPTHAVLCLPGRGQSGHQFMQGLINHGQFENTLLMSFTPHNFAWYPMPRNAMDQDAAVNGLPAAVFSIQEELADIQAEHGIPDGNLAIIGFSAGAVMALQYLFESQKPLAAVVAHSGAIFQPLKVPEAKTKTPVVLFHNTNDDCFDWEERFLPMQRALVENNYNTFELIDDGGHGMYVEDLEQVEMFLKSVGFVSNRLTTDERAIVPTLLTEQATPLS